MTRQEQERACDAAFQAWEDIFPSNDLNDIEHAAEAKEHEQLGLRSLNAWLSLMTLKEDPEPQLPPHYKQEPYTSFYFLRNGPEAPKANLIYPEANPT